MAASQEEHLRLHISSLWSLGSNAQHFGSEYATIPFDATMGHVIAQLQDESARDGCVGFLVTRYEDPTGMHYGYFDDEEEVEDPRIAQIHEQLQANGGTLLDLGTALASFGFVDAKTCAEFCFWPVWSDVAKHPIVYRKNVEERGFPEIIWNYVQLEKESLEIVMARKYFSHHIIPWIESSYKTTNNHPSQSLQLSEEDDFGDAPNQIYTVHICQHAASLDISCNNMAGELQCAAELTSKSTIADLQSLLCEKLQWAHTTVWDGADVVAASQQISRYSVLAVGKVTGGEQVMGCYQCNQTGHHPAGYSASGTTSIYNLVLESGRAGLHHHFKGDYKRAEELRQLVMLDARWSIEVTDDNQQFVRIVGKANLSRFWVHERDGEDGTTLNNYSCFALVKIPVEQLLEAQTSERFTHITTAGSGWSCGSENYNCSWFLPPCVLKAVREYNDPKFVGSALTKGCRGENAANEYPYSKMTRHRGYGPNGMVKINETEFLVLRHLRQHLIARAEVSLGELLELQAAAPRPQAERSANESDGTEDTPHCVR